jgi:hypothetical protein
MANLLNVIVRITGQNALGGALVQANQGLQLMQQSVQALDSTVGAFIRRGFAMNASLETTTLQFKTLMGSADLAKQHVDDLFKIGAQTPFATEEIIAASKALEVFGGAALDTHDNILMIGDAAAATGSDIAELGNWTGRLYSSLQAGRPFGEAAQRLQELAVLTPQARNEMERLQAAGASADEIWKVFEADMRHFTGAMQEQAGTWAGLTSTMNDTLDTLAAHVTSGLFTRAEADLRAFNEALGDPETTAKADALGQALGVVTDAAIGVGAEMVRTAPAFLVAETALDAYTRTAGDAGAANEQVVTTSDAVVAAMGRVTGSLAQVQAAITTTIAVSQGLAQAQAVAAQGADAAQAAAHAAEMQRLYDEGQALAHAGDITDIVNAEQVAARNFAAQQAEQAAQGQQRAEEKAARETAAAQAKAARDATAANREAARAAEQAWRESHQATAAGATHTAAVQIAAAQAVVDSTNAMPQQLTASYGNASGGLLMDTGSQAGRTRIYGMPLVHATVVNIDQRGATVGVDNLKRTITDTVNSGIRTGSVQVSGLGAR